MTEVRPSDNESIESLIRRFNKKIEASGMMQELRARQSYVKPSDAVRKEKAAGKSRMRKQQRKMQQQIDFENNNKFRPRKPFQQQQRPQGTDGQKKTYPPRPQQDRRPPPQQPQAKPVSQESLKSLQEKFNKE